MHLVTAPAPNAIRRLSTWSSAAGLVVAAAVVLLGVAIRLGVFAWQQPFTPHHPDEAILPLEAMALWEGITPREVGWPASTTRLLLGGAEAVQWFISDPQAGIAPFARDPLHALEGLAAWVGNRYVDPTPIYRTARWMMVCIGGLQLAALAWALRRWTRGPGAAVGLLAIALAPMPVEYSQYILSDMTGVLFATVLVGFLTRPLTTVNALGMGVLAGLAAASKFHFGIWILAPLCAIWLARDLSLGDRFRLSVVAVASTAGTILALVPWFWINPFLAAKEFAGVVLIKVAVPGQAVSLAANAWTVLGGLGTIALAGTILGLVAVTVRRNRAIVPVLVPTALAVAALAASAIVFDRYGLVALPGVTVLAAIGWDAGLTHARSHVRLVVQLVLVAAVSSTMLTLVRAQRAAAEPSVDLLARDWILDHVARGARVARHDEDNTYLPRTREQLAACAAGVNTPAAFDEKARTVGLSHAATAAEPMRSAVLNDELFTAYWCRRELLVSRDAGYDVVRYHVQPRFGSVLEAEAIDQFRSGAHTTSGPDVLVLNRALDVGVPPSALFETRRGVRVIYMRMKRSS